MYSQSAASSAHVPKKPPRFVQSESTKSRHGSRTPRDGYTHRRQRVQRRRRRQEIGHGRCRRCEKAAALVTPIQQPHAGVALKLLSEMPQHHDRRRRCGRDPGRQPRLVGVPAISGAESPN